MRFDPWLWIILAAGLGTRLLYFSAPYADAHRWRQIENLSVAWNFYQLGLNPFYPQAIWGGLQHAGVEMEFPIVPFLLAVAWKIFGFHELYGRVIGIASSAVLIWAVYMVGRQLVDRGVGRAAALLIALSPTAVFFGRVPMTDTPMIACSTLAILGYLRYFDEGSRGWAIGGAIAAAGAWLFKVPSLLILAPIGVIAWQARGWRALTDRRLIVGLGLAFLATVAWYGHANRTYEQTGWTVGISGDAGQHPAAIAAMSGRPSTFSLWSTPALLMSEDFYWRLFDRSWYIHLTPLGVFGVLFGLIKATGSRRGLVALAWFAGAIAFVLVVGFGNYWHEYYQLPVLPPAALLFGLAAGPLFAAPIIRDRLADVPDPPGTWWHASWHVWLERLSRPIIIGLVAIASFYYSGIIRNFFRPDTLDEMSIDAGEAISSHVPIGDGLIVVEYEQGTNSPVLLYFARRQGWSFDLKTISPLVLTRLKAQGATHFATTIYSQLRRQRPDVADYLQMQREVPLGPRAPDDTKLFELH